MPHLTTSSGIKWNYEISGQGEAVLFIHGFGGSSRWWFNQRPFMEKDFQVISVDLPGHGMSAWQKTSLLDMAKDLREISKHLHLHRFNIVASSFGGLVALELYRHMSEDISRISFVGSIPKFARSESYPAGLDIENIHKLSDQFKGDYKLVLDMFFRSLFTMKERESPAFKNVKDLRRSEGLPVREALQSFLNILEKADLRDRLSSVICPVQYITGKEDYICPIEIMEWIQDNMTNARLDFIDGCGHLPFLTKSEQYNELLENFLIN